MMKRLDRIMGIGMWIVIVISCASYAPLEIFPESNSDSEVLKQSASTKNISIVSSNRVASKPVLSTIKKKTKTKTPFVIYGIRTNKKVIALTFDDGPHPRYTQNILKILDKNKAKATFFLLGQNAKRYPEITKKIQQNGHDIGNHSFSHKDMHKLSKEKIEKEIKKTQKVLTNLLDTAPQYFRPPYGNLKPKHYPVVKKYLKNIIRWKVDSDDWKRSSTKESIVEQTLNGVKPGAIILMHDISKKNQAAVEIIIPKLIKRGYSFITITELLKYQHQQKKRSS